MRNIAVSITLFLAFQVSATQSLRWSTDLSTMDELQNCQYPPVRCNEFIDGSTALIFFQINTSSNKLLLLDQDGNKLFCGETDGMMFANFANSALRFGVHRHSSVRIYEKNDTSYSESDFSALNFPTGEGCGYPARSCYNISNSVLSKFSFDLGAPIIAASTSGISNSNFIVSWNSAAGIQYRIQKSNELSQWSDIGTPIIGTGTPLNWSTPVGSTSEFYRVIINQ